MKCIGSTELSDLILARCYRGTCYIRLKINVGSTELSLRPPETKNGSTIGEIKSIKSLKNNEIMTLLYKTQSSFINKHINNKPPIELT